MGQTTFIYALCDPDTNEVRYIGKADNPQKRLRRHLGGYEPNSTHKSNWIQSLLSIGKKPDLQILEEVSKSNWQEAEKRWIEHYRRLDGNLTNLAEGGVGGNTNVIPHLSDEERRRRSERAKKRMTTLWAEIRKEHEASKAAMKKLGKEASNE